MRRTLVPALLVFAATVFGRATIGNCPVLPADNIWNARIDHLPVASNSATLISTIGTSRTVHADFGSGLWDGGPIGIPFVSVPGSQPRYPVTFYYSGESDPGPYAVPLDAPIEGGANSTGDRHSLAIDRDNCILYELYRAFPQAASWQADSGAIYDLRSHSLRPLTWTSADAAGLPILPGLVRYDEVLAGEIRHAIRLTVPQTRKAFVWPARHYASSLTDPKYPPMGQRFRLRANYDITTFSRDAQVILTAMQRYGMIVADNGSAWYISGVPDPRWDNDVLHELGLVTGANFEAVDATALMIDPNSGQARQSSITVTVTPASSMATTGRFVQFNAIVNNSTNQAVVWSVSGVAGGSATVGFITSAGGYTAPASVPSPASVTVQATSAAQPTSIGSASVTIVPPPAITSLTPASLATGAFTLGVNGARFQTGAIVSFGGTALATTFLSSTQLQASGMASSPSAGIPVVVTNPDGSVSNSVSVAVISSLPVSVTVAPAWVKVRTGRSQPFSALVLNSQNQAVTWWVNGVAGGSTTYGTITSTGLYTAPPNIPSPDSVTITAKSVAAPSASGSASAKVVQKR